jgi:curli biogenesis system outer membrane secretion channel CsgG
MKKTYLLLLIATFALGCKSKSATNTKLNNKAEVAIKGDWNISSVTYPGSDYIKVSSFDVADSKCFVGSQWKFISNNNKGTMALNNASCGSFSSPITWFVNKEGQLVLKIINETKSKKVLSGYVLRVANMTDSSFQLIDKIDVGGKMVDVVYQYARN